MRGLATIEISQSALRANRRMNAEGSDEPREPAVLVTRDGQRHHGHAITRAEGNWWTTSMAGQSIRVETRGRVWLDGVEV